MSNSREWQWPSVGPTPVNYGLDTEIFDSERFPHAQTFVREAIQNSLDARQDPKKPVIVRFALHKGELGERGTFLADLRAKKEASGLAWPNEWDSGQINWLVVEDTNSTGLRGNLEDRASDFWNYWLNFGISNKSGSGRGGRGIGRITFLIASGISTVIGLTSRLDDGKIVACGMSVLKPGMLKGRFMSSYAYLAQAPSENVYELYDDPSFVADLTSAFSVINYAGESTTGLSLIIPYPHEKLTRDAIIAAAIENFAPAIISGVLVVKADDHTVDSHSIGMEAERVASAFSASPLRDEPQRFLELVQQCSLQPDFTIPFEKANEDIDTALGPSKIEEIRNLFASHEKLTFSIALPVTRNGKTTKSYLHAALSRTSKGKKPFDFFFREGMCLPEVSARNLADVDLVLLSKEGELATYLNCCEGKAHLGLIENKEVAAKLLEKGFTDKYSIKRKVRHLPDDLRRIVLPDVTKPDASIFSSFFSVPKQDHGKQKEDAGSGKKEKPTSVPSPLTIPEPRPRIFKVDDLLDGFRVRIDPEYTGQPVALRLKVAYADGTRNPKWSKFDFEFRKLSVTHSGGDAPEYSENMIRCRNCGPDFRLEVTGFDTRRELVTHLEAISNA